MMAQEEDKQEQLTGVRISHSLGLGMGKAALIGISAFALIGFFLAMNHASSTNATTNNQARVQEVVQLRKKDDKEEEGPDFKVCREQCGKFQAGCKAKAAARIAKAGIWMAATKTLCRTQCVVDNKVDKTKANIVSKGGGLAVASISSVMSAKYPPLERPLHAVDATVKRLLEVRSDVIKFRSKIEATICKTKCYGKATWKQVKAVGKKKEPELLCYYGQAKAYAVEKLWEELEEINTWAQDWVNTKKQEIQNRIDNVTNRFSNAVHHLGQEIVDSAKQTKQHAYDLMVDALNVTTTVLEPVFTTYQVAKSDVIWIKTTIENLQELKDEAIADALMLADLAVLFITDAKCIKSNPK